MTTRNRRLRKKTPAPAATPRARQRGGVALPILGVLALAGLASLIYGLTSDGAGPDIALLTVSYLFLLGITQVGVVFAATLRLVEADWAKPWYRLAELSTLAFFPFAIAGFLFIVSVGADDLFYWLDATDLEHPSPWLDSGWLVARNLGALLLFYGVAGYYTLTSLRPDLASGDGTAIDHDAVERRLYLMSPIVIACFILSNTFLAWDFGMMLIPHWHSTVFPIHFWFGNVFAGTAALIAIVVVMRRVDGAKHFGPHQLKSLGMMITGFTLLWLYFFWAQFFVIWFGNLPHETTPLWRQMYGHYGPWFWTMIAGCFFLPFAAFLFAVVKRSVVAMCVIAIAINVGIWTNKYLMIVPVFSPADRPFDSWIDVTVSVGLAAAFLVTLVLLARRLPTYSAWEMARES